MRPVDDDRWGILDDSDHQVFCGTLRECEAWLDRAENLAAQSSVQSRQRSPFFLKTWLKQLFARPATADAPRESVESVESVD